MLNLKIEQELQQMAQETAEEMILEGHEAEAQAIHDKLFQPGEHFPAEA